MATKKEKPYYEMFTKAGDKACHSLISKVVKKILGKERVTRDGVTAMIKSAMKKTAVKHGEINDTEPEGHVQDAVNKTLKEAGYGFEVNRFDW